MDERMELWKQGLIDAEIARLTGCTRTAIHKWRQRNGISPNKKMNITGKDKQRMDLWSQGYTDLEIRKLLGISHNAIASWRRTRNLPANRQHKEPVKKNRKTGVDYRKVLPPKKWPVIERFLSDLSHCAAQAPGKKLDIGAFLTVWAKIDQAA